MPADLSVVPETKPPMISLAEYLLANDVPKEHVTAASAAFGAWLEQLGEGNALHMLLYTAEALKVSQDNTADLTATVARVEALCVAVENRMMATAKPSEIRAALSGGVA